MTIEASRGPRVATALLGLVLLACVAEPEAGDEAGEAGETGEDQEPEAICDGSEDLRLGMRGGGGWIFGLGVRVQLGRDFLYVRGDCRYWVQPGELPPAGEVDMVRAGTLDEAQAQALAEQLHYGLWAGVAGHYGDNDTQDGNTVTIFDQDETLSCYGACPEAPDFVHDLTVERQALLDELWAGGEAVEGPLRVAAAALDEGVQVSAVEWTVAELDLASIAVPIEDAYTGDPSVLIDDPNTVAALRAFRDAHIQAMAEDFYVDAGGIVYAFDLRDVLPVEAAEGGIPQPQ
jgi:hypothetical protein